ncbi:hypothetical protein AB6N24_17865 [Cellulomonas sp. 179-A 4D5 NHS]|uniref:hypothetical protein n=1 Tax=Cellulomonas sp. 179-A 4D5 NHS TaxID=3142378 RepID=UPI0039A33EF6
MLITGTALLFEQIAERRHDLPYPLDTARILEAPTPANAAAAARDIEQRYAGLLAAPGPDGVDEHWRISNMAGLVAGIIDSLSAR